jgi:peroxiredoxin
MSVLRIGQSAPQFGLSAIGGNKYSLQEGLKNGPLLAAFFKVACPTCQYTFPFLERLYQQLRSSGVQIWGISQDEVKDSRRFAREYSVTFPILIDDYPYHISREYGLECVPSIFLIAADGSIKIQSEGFAKRHLLEIQKSLAQTLSVSVGALFQPSEKIPEFKPG